MSMNNKEHDDADRGRQQSAGVELNSTPDIDQHPDHGLSQQTTLAGTVGTPSDLDLAADGDDHNDSIVSAGPEDIPDRQPDRQLLDQQPDQLGLSFSSLHDSHEFVENIPDSQAVGPLVHDGSERNSPLPSHNNRVSPENEDAPSSLEPVTSDGTRPLPSEDWSQHRQPFDEYDFSIDSHIDEDPSNLASPSNDSQPSQFEQDRFRRNSTGQILDEGTSRRPKRPRSLSPSDLPEDRPSDSRRADLYARSGRMREGRGR